MNRMMRTKIFRLLWGLLLVPALQGLHAQGSQVVSAFTTESFRRQFYEGLIRWSIMKNLSVSLQDADEEYDFQSALWPMELVRYRNDSVRSRLAYAFGRAPGLGTGLQRGLVEVAYANYPETFRDPVRRLLMSTQDPRIFAMCAEYLWRGGAHPGERVPLSNLLHRRFPPDSLVHNPILQMLDRRLRAPASAPMPPLADLLSQQFAPGLTVLYSFQRPNRDYPGLVIVRGPDGHFVRDSTGALFAVPQLARAISNLPFYLTNGNTPQGVYRMSGFDVSRSRFIGPTPNIQLSMPYEIRVDSFIIPYLPGDDTLWTRDAYRLLLPPSWQDYFPVYESYYAGKAGRTAIIAHGTTIDPEYYRGEPYYPQTPSLGCLCAFESWSPLDGHRLRSDQQRLVDAVMRTGAAIGYLVVLELGHEDRPLAPEELLPFVAAAEKRL